MDFMLLIGKEIIFSSLSGEYKKDELLESARYVLNVENNLHMALFSE